MNKEQNDAASEEVLENDNSTDPSTENNETDDTQPGEGENTQPDLKPKPFHEDPQVQDYIARQMQNREAALRGEILKEAEEKFSPKQKDQVAIPAWFGGDEEAWKQYQTSLDERDARVRENTLKEIQGLTQKEQQAVQEANDWFESNVKEIEKEEGITIDRTLLLKTAQEFELVDSKQRWNWKAAWRIAKAQFKGDPTKVDQRKKIVGITDNDRGEGEGKRDFKGQADFRKSKPW